MQTAFFIDGYNVFYGLLAGTPYKWLDLPSLLHAIAHENHPHSQVAEIHYFTSPVQPALATRGIQSAARQCWGAPDSAPIEQIVLVSGDTDMTPALEAIREDFPHLRIGIILPHRKGIERAPPGSLRNNADWMRRYVAPEELEAHQLPGRVHTRKKTADKPDYW